MDSFTNKISKYNYLFKTLFDIYFIAMTGVRPLPGLVRFGQADG